MGVLGQLVPRPAVGESVRAAPAFRFHRLRVAHARDAKHDRHWLHQTVGGPVRPFAAALVEVGASAESHVAVARGVDGDSRLHIDRPLLRKQPRTRHAIAIQQRLGDPRAEEDLTPGLLKQLRVPQINELVVHSASTDVLQDILHPRTADVAHQRAYHRRRTVGHGPTVAHETRSSRDSRA